MAKFKVGDRVRVKCTRLSHGEGVVTLENPAAYSSYEFKTSNSYCGGGGFDTCEILGYEVKDLDHLEVGDVLLAGIHEYPVVVALGQAIALEDSDGDFDDWYTISEIKRGAWGIKQSEPEDDTIELTLEEVAALKGVPVERLRIKD